MACPDLVEVKLAGEWELEVAFVDGLEGRALFKKRFLRGALAPLQDLGLFEKVAVEDGTLTWPGGIELAAEPLYEAIAREGVWIGE